MTRARYQMREAAPATEQTFDGASCKDCIFMYEANVPTCRRRSPSSDQNGDTQWPMVLEWYWCGEFIKAKVEG